MSLKERTTLINAINQKVSRRKLLIGTSMAAGATMMPWRMATAGGMPSIKGRDPNTLIIAIDATVENLDPATNIELAYGLRPIYDTLLELDGRHSDKYRPRLAEAVTTNDDQSVWTFSLRKGVKFHDGSDCDAAAVKEAIIRSVSLPIGIGFVWFIDDPDAQIQILDSHTLEFTFESPRPTFGLEVSGQYGFWIASPKAFNENSLGDDDWGHEFLASNPVGTGAYMMELNDPGSQVTYAKNPDYWGGWDKPHFERVITRTVPLSGTRRQLLEQGEVDIIFPGTAEDTVALSKDPRFVVTNDLTTAVQYIALGNYGPLADPRARQAINLAFNNEAYIRDVLLGIHDMPLGTFSQQIATADANVTTLGFDLAKARELLDAAGVEQGTVLTFVYYTGYGDVAGELLQAWLSEIGITLKLVEKSFNGFIGDYFSDAPAEERANMYFFSWLPSFDHPVDYAYPLFHSDSWGSMGGNAGYYKNAEVDELLYSMWQMGLDNPELQVMSSRMQEILSYEDPAWVTIVQERMHFTLRKDIAGLELNPVYVYTLNTRDLSRDS